MMVKPRYVNLCTTLVVNCDHRRLSASRLITFVFFRPMSQDEVSAGSREVVHEALQSFPSVRCQCSSIDKELIGASHTLAFAIKRERLNKFLSDLVCRNVR